MQDLALRTEAIKLDLDLDLPEENKADKNTANMLNL